MATSFYVLISERRGQRPLLNGILAVLAGICSLIWPEWLYMMVGVYFLLLAFLSLYFKGNTLLTATAAVAGLFIFIYPALIPVTFAIFLIVFGLVSIMTSVFVWVGRHCVNDGRYTVPASGKYRLSCRNIFTDLRLEASV